MTEPKNHDEGDSNDANVDETTRRLIAIDESTADGQLLEALNTTPDGADLADYSDCLRLIERVRLFQPDCLADLSSDGVPTATSLDPLPFEANAEYPKQFGRFEVRNQLGDGGFGVIFLAFDPTLNREVALKIPRLASLMDETNRQRFLREARAAASLSHPHIATVHESGSVGPVCYIASAYYQGGSLADALARVGPCDVLQTARLVAAIADGVQYAHSRGILHRDLKPSNVLVDSAATDDLRPESLRIADFGLARILEEDTEATKTGALIGTPAYMSPEQAESRLGDISTQSDVYALGAILYELLSGRPPFRAASTLATLEAVRTREPEPPSHFRRGIPRDLEAICLKCLQKSPTRRYVTAQALSDDLGRWLDGRPVHARSATATERLLRWCRRNPALTAASLMAVLAVVVGVAASTILWMRAERNARREALRSQQLTAAVDNLHSALDMLFVTVAESPELRGYGAEPLRKQLLDQASKYYQLVVAQRSSDDDASRDYAETLFRLGLVNQQLGDQAGAEIVLREALAELERIPVSVERQLNAIEWHRRLAQVLDKLGRHDEARQTQKQAIELARNTATDSAETRQACLVSESALWSDMAGGELIESNLAGARNAVEQAKGLWEKAAEVGTFDLDSDHCLSFANSLFVLGVAEEESSKLEESENHHRQALALLESRYADSKSVEGSESLEGSLLLSKVYKKLGISLAKQERLDDARIAYQEGMEILDGLRLRHPLVPEYSMEWCSTRYSLSVTEYLAGNHGRTLELLKENAHTYTALADTYPDQRVDYLNRAAVGWNMISTVDKELGDLDGARHAIELALEIYQRVESERPDWIFNQVLIAESEVNLGGLLVDDGQMDFAKERFQSAIRRAERTVKEQPDHERGRRVLYGARNALAEQYYKLNQLEAAFSENAAALDVFQDALAWQAHLRQAQLAAKNGDYPASEVILRNFIEEIAARQEHFLEAARSAVATAQAVPPNQQTQIDRFRGIGREALSRAEELSAEKASVFRAKLIQDALLQTLISD